MRRPELPPIVLAAVLLWVSGQAMSGAAQADQNSKANTIPLSLCQLAKNPKDFLGKNVSLKARYETTVIEGGTWLEDDSCPQYGLELLVPADVRNHPENHPDYAALEHAVLRTGSIGTVDKTVIGRFTGQLVKKRSHRIPLAMVYGRVDDLSVELHRSGR